MRSRSHLGRVVFWAVALTVAGAAVCGGASAQTRPNFVVVMSDDQTLEQMRALPRTRRLIGGDRGTTFANHFTNYALCCPSRVTFSSGQHASNHGVKSNSSGQGGGYGSFDFSNALGVWLQRAGYWTAHIGKQLNGYGVFKPAVVEPGYDDWFVTVDPFTYRSYDYTVNDNGAIRHYGSSPADYQTDVLVDRAVRDIRARAGSDRPFFIHLAPQPPHWEIDLTRFPLGTKPPRPAPRHRRAFLDETLPRSPSFNEADVSDKPRAIRRRPRLTTAQIRERRQFYARGLAALLALDEGVQRIVETLRDTGELARTVLVFTSDNGSYFGEHRIARGKVLPYEEAVHVPLLIRGPGFPRGALREQPVSNVDLPATLVELAGASPGRVLDGSSLRRIAADPTHGRERAVFIEADVAPDANVDEGTAKARFAGVRTERFKYVEHPDTGERELYDLLRDPYELESRHADPRYAPVRAELRDALERLRTCKGERCLVRVRRCEVAGGALRSTGIDGIRLGAPREDVRRRRPALRPRPAGDLACIYGGGYLRVAYHRGRVALVLAGDRRYGAFGLRPGSRTHQRGFSRIGGGRRIQWYARRNGRRSLIAKVDRGRIAAVGVAVRGDRATLRQLLLAD